MPYISKFTASDGVTYDLKDSEARDQKIGKIADHSITGSAGWYKFLEFSSSSQSRRKITLLIQDTRASGAPIIMTSYINPSSGANTFSIIAGGSAPSTAGAFINEHLAFYSENETHTWYVQKSSTSGYAVHIQVLSSYWQNGTYFDLTDYWVSQAVSSLPEGAIYPTPMSDGAGNVIPDTYATKIALDAKVNDSVIAPVEPTSTASEYHNAGEVFILNGNLYWATDTIAVGETIVPGTNAQLMTVARYTDYVGEMLWESVSGSYVPTTRTINGKALSANITLDAADVAYSSTASGLSATNVQDAIDEVAGDIPSVPTAYTSNPAMDGTASAGSSGNWARGDHVHPSDTSRVPTTRTINGKALSADVSLSARDVGAQKPIVYDNIVFPLSWSGSGPYTEIVTTQHVEVEDEAIVSLLPTPAQLAQLMADGVTALTIENNMGTLTAYALGAAPTTAMVMGCTLTLIN